jgi:hypothetical protein
MVECYQHLGEMYCIHRWGCSWCWWPSTTLHNVTSQNTIVFTLLALTHTSLSVYKPPVLSTVRFLKCVETVASGVSTLKIKVPSWLASKTIYELKAFILSATVRRSFRLGNWMLTCWQQAPLDHIRDATMCSWRHNKQSVRLEACTVCGTIQPNDLVIMFKVFIWVTYLYSKCSIRKKHGWKITRTNITCNDYFCCAF